jgi:hypothetical protein
MDPFLFPAVRGASGAFNEALIHERRMVTPREADKPWLRAGRPGRAEQLLLSFERTELIELTAHEHHRHTDLPHGRACNTGGGGSHGNGGPEPMVGGDHPQRRPGAAGVSGHADPIPI